MRKLAIILLVLPFFTACNQKELNKLKEENAQLTQIAQKRDSTINDFVESFQAIAANLDTIKVREKLISVQASGEQTADSKTQILSDLSSVKNLLDKNKAELADLNKKLKNSWYQNSKLKKLTESLQKQIQEKEESIANLTAQVTELNGKVDNLNGQVAQLNDTVSSLSTQNSMQEKLLNEKTDKLHTAYYVIGTTKELRDQHVISATGGLLGIGRTDKLNDQIDPSKFTAIDITKTTTIPVKGKKINMVTAHPADSYKIEEKDNEVEAITITNPEEFWKASKYLVVAER